MATNPEMLSLAERIKSDPKLKAEFDAKYAVPLAWHAGDLTYKLDPNQLAMFDLIHEKWATKPVSETTALALPLTDEERLKNIPASWFYLLCARGFGKSVLFCVIATMTALKKPKRQIIYAAPTKDEAAKIGSIIMDTFILNDVPAELKPDYDPHKKVMTFQNGSVIEFRACNGGHADELRGPGAHLFILDELGTIDQPLYIVRSIADPMIERWDGRLLMATTPAVTPSHESTRLYLQMQADGLAVKYTLLQNTRRSWVEKAKALRGAGESDIDIPEILAGRRRPKTTDARREYFCEFVTDAGRAVLPHWQDLESERLWSGKRPAFFHGHSATDPGIINKTAILYGHYDFERGVFVIERERFLRGINANHVGVHDAMVADETALWGPRRFAGGRDQPAKRVMDPDARLGMDLANDFGMRFISADKKDSKEGFRWLDSLVVLGQLEVAPECVELRRQMRDAIWNMKATDLDEEEDGGHWDGLAALKYFCRSFNTKVSPFPKDYRVTPRHDDIILDVQPEKKASLLPDSPLGRRIEAKAVRPFGVSPFRRR